jgi:hypothetical protein
MTERPGRAFPTIGKTPFKNFQRLEKVAVIFPMIGNREDP